MAIEPTRTEENLWKFALVCTNDATGAARVVASLVRDHRDLGRLSETRLRRAVLERSRVWLERARDASVEVGQRVSPILVRFDIEERALLWLDGALSLSIVEQSHVLGSDPGELRSRLSDLDATVDDMVSVIVGIEESVNQTPIDQLQERVQTARENSARRSRRRSVFLIIGFLFFVGVMLFVLFDLLNWQDASQTLPDQNVAPVQRGFAQ